MPARCDNKMAASVTVRASGPAVSCVAEIGIIPERLHKPTVGLIPTRPFTDAGLTTDPFVSVPMAIVQRFAATADAEPELEPDGLRSRTYGHLVWPPRLLHPLVEKVERKLANSLKFVFPNKTAPASLSRLTINASLDALFPSSAKDPAVVIILSPVSMLSFIKTGMP